jgi:hypothetical protein
MYNCHKLIVNGRLFGIFHTWERASSVAHMLDSLEKIEYKIEADFVENIGF